jgi:hypothetical protein
LLANFVGLNKFQATIGGGAIFKRCQCASKAEFLFVECLLFVQLEQLVVAIAAGTRDVGINATAQVWWNCVVASNYTIP